VIRDGKCMLGGRRDRYKDNRNGLLPYPCRQYMCTGQCVPGLYLLPGRLWGAGGSGVLPGGIVRVHAVSAQEYILCKGRAVSVLYGIKGQVEGEGSWGLYSLSVSMCKGDRDLLVEERDHRP